MSAPFTLPVTTAKAKASRNIAGRAVPSSCEDEITPTCLQDLYGIPSNPPVRTSNFISVSEYEEEYASVADLQVKKKF